MKNKVTKTWLEARQFIKDGRLEEAEQALEFRWKYKIKEQKVWKFSQSIFIKNIQHNGRRSQHIYRKVHKSEKRYCVMYNIGPH